MRRPAIASLARLMGLGLIVLLVVSGPAIAQRVPSKSNAGRPAGRGGRTPSRSSASRPSASRPSSPSRSSARPPSRSPSRSRSQARPQSRPQSQHRAQSRPQSRSRPSASQSTRSRPSGSAGRQGGAGRPSPQRSRAGSPNRVAQRGRSQNRNRGSRSSFQLGIGGPGGLYYDFGSRRGPTYRRPGYGYPGYGRSGYGYPGYGYPRYGRSGSSFGLYLDLSPRMYGQYYPYPAVPRYRESDNYVEDGYYEEPAEVEQPQLLDENTDANTRKLEKRLQAIRLVDFGDGLFQQGNYKESLAQYDESVKVDGKATEAGLHRGYALLAMEKYSEAAKSIGGAVRRGAPPATLIETASILYWEHPQVKRAHLDKLAESALANRTSADHYYLVGVFLYADDQGDRAQDFLRRAAALTSGDTSHITPLLTKES